MNETFKNSWSGKLKLTSIFFTLVLIAISVALYIYTKNEFSFFVWVLTWLSTILVIPAAMAFIVKHYELTHDRILIHRPFRSNVIRYQIIKKVKKLEDAKKGLVRTFGIGGLYSYTGAHTNKEIGLFHAYVNDWDRAVMVETLYGKHVLSPNDPDGFIEAVNKRLKSSSNESAPI